MSEYITKDSGARDAFQTGFVRDTQAGKPRPALVSPFFMERLGALLARGAVKYGDNNWMLGQPFTRALDSLERHLMQWKQGVADGEDHLAAVAFGVMCLLHYEEGIKRGFLSSQLDDRPDYTSKPPLRIDTTKGVWSGWMGSGANDRDVIDCMKESAHVAIKDAAP